MKVLIEGGFFKGGDKLIWGDLLIKEENRKLGGEMTMGLLDKVASGADGFEKLLFVGSGQEKIIVWSWFFKHFEEGILSFGTEVVGLIYNDHFAGMSDWFSRDKMANFADDFNPPSSGLVD